MTRAVLSLGSNLGDREANLTRAVAGLRDWVVAVSGVYETEPWGDAHQPPYLNAVVLVADPDAGPNDWLERTRRLETEAGRTRDPARRFGPRTLDIDVITVYSDDGVLVESEDQELTLPHPRAHLRAFVLRPWIDVDPYGRLPQGWLTDLLQTEPVVADLADVRPRTDITLESG